MFNLCNKNRKNFPVRSFTYFIPAPPNRKTGYQEREFDQILDYITKAEFKIVKISTESISNNEMAGMWVILLLQPETKEASLMSFDFEYKDIVNKNLNDHDFGEIIHES